MGQEQIILAFNWQNFWKVWIGIGAVIGITIWVLITAVLVGATLGFMSGESDDDGTGCVTIPITIVWIGLSIAIYAGMH